MNNSLPAKRCPSCHKGVDVDPTRQEGTCIHCGVSYEVIHTSGSSGKTGISHGIKLRSFPKKKYCPTCKQKLDASEFNKHASAGDGLATYCRDCARKRNKAYARSKNGYVYKASVDVPDFPSKSTLGNVLPYLIKISKIGKNKNLILNDSLEKIKEALV